MIRWQACCRHLITWTCSMTRPATGHTAWHYRQSFKQVMPVNKEAAWIALQQLEASPFILQTHFLPCIMLKSQSTVAARIYMELQLRCYLALRHMFSLNKIRGILPSVIISVFYAQPF